MALQLPLTKGKIAIVDECDAHLANYKWCCHSMGYAMRGFKIKGKSYPLFLHHAIMGKPLHKLVVDHIDGNKLNNTRSNLRIVTWRENSSNTKKQRGEKPKTSKYVGAFLAFRNRKNKYWRSAIVINGKQVTLGYFKNEVDAANAYKNALNNLIAEENHAV